MPEQPELLFRVISESGFNQSANGLPNSYRSTNQLPPQPQGQNYQGLESLNAAGCSQFNLRTLETILVQAPAGPVIVVSLRKEPHAFAMGDADGMPISWYGPHNDLNKGKSPEDAMAAQNNLILRVNQRLEHMDSPHMEVFTSDKGDKLETVHTSHLVDEKELVAQLNITSKDISHRDFCISDHYGPTNQIVDQIVQLFRELLAYQQEHGCFPFVLYHCRGGKGRTTTVMAMWDIVVNGENVDLIDILTRQAQPFGFKDLLNINYAKHEAWRRQAAIDRLLQIIRFYHYVKDIESGFHAGNSFSDWRTMHPVDDFSEIVTLIPAAEALLERPVSPLPEDITPENELLTEQLLPKIKLG